jgi:nucleotide-binding universal stress UspA family protein
VGTTAEESTTTNASDVEPAATTTVKVSPTVTTTLPSTTPPPTTTATELVDAESLAAFCDDLQSLFETMGGTTGEPNIEPTTSVEVVKSYASDVADAYENVASSARDLGGAAIVQIETARVDFENAVDAIPDDGTMEEVFEQFADAWGAYVTAVGAPLISDCGEY